MPTYQDLLQQAKRDIKEVNAAQLAERLGSESRPVLIDVREQDEVDQGIIPGALHIPRGFLETRAEKAVPNRDTPVAVYCAGGVRSAFAAQTMQQLGYSNVVSLSGGFTAWKEAGQRFAQPRIFSEAQRRRYARHFVIPEVGEEGQGRLLDAKVLLVGAGGLGAPAALYLAAAGVGTLGIVDDDVVDDSNLQRQVIHATSRLGQSKVDSARGVIEDLNPDVKVVSHKLRLDASNALGILREYDIILDGADNFSTRYLLNDAAVLLDKPVVHGSIYRFEGQVTTYWPKHGPCYRCQYPEPPPPELAPNCADAGVLGILPGIIGLLEANEVVKLILGVGEPLMGRLLTFDALSTTFEEYHIYRDPECPACGEHATVKTLEDIAVACAASLHQPLEQTLAAVAGR